MCKINFKKIFPKIINNIFFVVGLCLILLPIVLKIISSFNQTSIINNYNDKVSQMQQDSVYSIEEDAKDFNSNLYNNNSFDSSLSQDNISTIDLSGMDILGYISIPKINVELPIYEGSSDNVLSLGIGHLSNTSLPCGGINTHCVLVGHTGLSNSIMFDDLDKLEIGDKFSINFLGNTLQYEVNNINIVEPDETQSLIIKENEDLVTLITCTPKHVNTHRLLVTGSRILVEEGSSDIIQSEVSENTEVYAQYHEKINLTVNVIFILLFIIFVAYFLKNMV